MDNKLSGPRDWAVLGPNLQSAIDSIGSNILLKSTFVKASEKVLCMCTVCEHEWFCAPTTLITGVGCGKCFGRGLTTTEVQEKLDSTGKAVTIISEYTKTLDKVKVRCKVCYNEWDTLIRNIKGIASGCPACKADKLELERKIKQEEFAIWIRDNKNYRLLSDYKNSTTKIEFLCTDCGKLNYKIPRHIKTHECSFCSPLKKLDLETVKLRLKEVNPTVEVSGKYVNAHTHLTCLCLECSRVWKASTSNLLSGRGCSDCNSAGGYDNTKPGFLYYLRVVDGTTCHWKIGITNLGVKERFRPADRVKITVLYCQLFEDGKTAQVAEKNILSLFREHRAQGVKILQNGNTELFTKDVLQMDHLYWGPI